MFGMFSPRAVRMPAKQEALPGRSEPIPVAPNHAVLGTPMKGPWPGAEVIHVGMGCFWGAERVFWTLDGVISTAVGYGAGFTPNPTYEEACSGLTGHTEGVRVVYDPSKISFVDILRWFWEAHDPTSGMGQGNDRGTQVRPRLRAVDPAATALLLAAVAATDGLCVEPWRCTVPLGLLLLRRGAKGADRGEQGRVRVGAQRCGQGPRSHHHRDRRGERLRPVRWPLVLCGGLPSTVPRQAWSAPLLLRTAAVRLAPVIRDVGARGARTPRAQAARVLLEAARAGRGLPSRCGAE